MSRWRTPRSRMRPSRRSSTRTRTREDAGDEHDDDTLDVGAGVATERFAEDFVEEEDFLPEVEEEQQRRRKPRRL